jgi:hypothetical protein
MNGMKRQDDKKKTHTRSRHVNAHARCPRNAERRAVKRQEIFFETDERERKIPLDVCRARLTCEEHAMGIIARNL